MTENAERERDDRGNTPRQAAGKATRAKQGRAQGFRLSHNPAESEEAQREKEHKDVKVKCRFGSIKFGLKGLYPDALNFSVYIQSYNSKFATLLSKNAKNMNLVQYS